MVVRVKCHGGHQLLEIVHAGNGLGLFPGGQRWQQKRPGNRDAGDNDKQLQQRECTV